MKNAQFNFQHLTPEVILAALASVGIYPESGLLGLNSYENRVYQFQAEDRRRLVAKFYRPERWSRAALQQEHDFCCELADAGVAIAAPLIIDGSSLFEFAGFYFCLYPNIAARTIELDNWEQLESLGRTLGQMHKIGAKRLFSNRPEINLELLAYQPRNQLATSQFIPSAIETSFFNALDELISAIAKKWQPSAFTAIRLHGDLHQSNILWREQAVILDFDDARNGPAIQDIWMLLSGDRRDQLAQIDTLSDAYGEFFDFPFEQLQLIEVLRSLRMVHYMAWQVTRWSDPAFPRAFPWLSEASYWEKQRVDIKEQINLLESAVTFSNPQW